MVQLVAHRGYAARFPENTRLALAAAIAEGARYLEVDVQLSRDGVPVLFHDANGARLCGVPLVIGEESYETLTGLSVFAPARFGERFRGTPLARLQELADLLAEHPHVSAFVEIKPDTLQYFDAVYVVAAICEVLSQVSAQVVLISFALELLEVVRNRGLRLGVIAQRYAELTRPEVTALHPEYRFCDLTGLPEGTLAAADVDLIVYEVPSVAVARGLQARGLSWFETFAIGELLRELAVPGHGQPR